MKPYTKDKHMGAPKFKAERPSGINGGAKGISAYDKLVIKNANRSRKKSKRQESKKIIKDEITRSQQQNK